jgi:YD repeat-containing protein
MILIKRISTFVTIIFILLVTVAAFSLTVSYQYDNLDRLTRVERSDGSITTYTYDVVGNRISKINTASVLGGDINNDGSVTLTGCICEQCRRRKQ